MITKRIMNNRSCYCRVCITLKGDGAVHTIGVSGNNDLFSLTGFRSAHKITMILDDEHIIFHGQVRMNNDYVSLVMNNCVIQGRVYVGGGTFTMKNGVISGNEAVFGGGVYIDSGGTFTKSGNSVIYGDTDNIHDIISNPNENTATGGTGHAVAHNGGRKRNSDAGAGQNMDTGLIGAAGGWE